MKEWFLPPVGSGGLKRQPWGGACKLPSRRVATARQPGTCLPLFVPAQVARHSVGPPQPDRGAAVACRKPRGSLQRRRESIWQWRPGHARARAGARAAITTSRGSRGRLRHPDWLGVRPARRCAISRIRHCAFPATDPSTGGRKMTASGVASVVETGKYGQSGAAGASWPSLPSRGGACGWCARGWPPRRRKQATSSRFARMG